MAAQNVEVTLKPGKKFAYSQISVVVYRGDKITWKLKKKNSNVLLPFTIIIKSPVTPLEWSTKKSNGGKIEGTVREDAEPGFYPYALCYVDGTNLLVDDPDIIVHPPRRS